MFSEITIGTRYAWNSTVIEVESIDTPAVITARNLATRECLCIPVAELAPIDPLGDSQSTPVDAISEEDWVRAEGLRKALEQVTAKPGHLPHGFLTKLESEFGLNRRQIQRYRNRFNRRMVTSSLAPKKRGRKEGSSCLSHKTEAAISHCLRRYYFVRERPLLSHIIERVHRLCRRVGCPIPSEGAIRRRRDRLDIYETNKKRLGAKAAGQKFKVRAGKLMLQRFLQRIQIDHTVVDAFVVSDDLQRTTLSRPWLTVAIDVYTRCIVGFYLSLDEPSAVSVAVCISHTLLPKEPWLRELGLDAPWPMFGRPELIATDNATEFRGTAMARGCTEYGIDLEFRPVGRPHWGGHIERLIGTLMGRVHLLPGTTFSNPQQRGDYDSEGRACMTLGELQTWLVHEICYRYHNKWHRGIGTTPTKAWMASTSQTSTIN